MGLYADAVKASDKTASAKLHSQATSTLQDHAELVVCWQEGDAPAQLLEAAWLCWPSAPPASHISTMLDGLLVPCVGPLSSY